jgi:hypothetical protein
MSFSHWRGLTASAIVLVCGIALSGCTPEMNMDNSRSTAAVEQFLDHLEAGEATAAAAMTDVDFPAELIDDSFYAASTAIPSNAHIVSTRGYDGGGFAATVEYLLDDAAQPESLELRVSEIAGSYTITGLESELSTDVGPYPAAGVVRVNDTIDYTLANTNRLTLLPAQYAFSYSDPTGLLWLGNDSSADFAVTSPASAGLSIFPTLMPDVDPAITAEITRLKSACADEGFIGPSCPPELVDAITTMSLPVPDAADWFRESGPDTLWNGQGFTMTATYLIQSDRWPMNITGTYSGTVTRDAAGAVILTRP